MAAKNEVFEIKVYDKEKKVVKTCKAVDCDLMFGSVRKLMALLEVDDATDTRSIFNLLYAAWDELVEVLSECFPDMEDKDWDNVKVNELIPTVKGIAINMLLKASSLPSDNSKN